MVPQLCGHESAGFYLVLHPRLFFKTYKSLFNTILGQYGIISDDVGWCIGFNKGGDMIYNVDIGLRVILMGVGNNNQSAPSDGSLIGSSIIVVDGGSIL